MSLVNEFLDVQKSFMQSLELLVEFRKHLKEFMSAQQSSVIFPNLSQLWNLHYFTLEELSARIDEGRLFGDVLVKMLSSTKALEEFAKNYLNAVEMVRQLKNQDPHFHAKLLKIKVKEYTGEVALRMLLYSGIQYIQRTTIMIEKLIQFSSNLEDRGNLVAVFHLFKGMNNFSNLTRFAYVGKQQEQSNTGSILERPKDLPKPTPSTRHVWNGFTGSQNPDCDLCGKEIDKSVEEIMTCGVCCSVVHNTCKASMERASCLPVNKQLQVSSPRTERKEPVSTEVGPDCEQINNQNSKSLSTEQQLPSPFVNALVTPRRAFPSKRCRKQGLSDYVQLRNGSSHSHRTATIHELFLFDDSLLISVQNTVSKAPMVVRSLIKWTSQQTKRKVQLKDSKANTFLLIPPQDNVYHVFNFSTLAEKEEWVDAITTAIVEYEERKLMELS